MNIITQRISAILVVVVLLTQSMPIGIAIAQETPPETSVDEVASEPTEPIEQSTEPPADAQQEAVDDGVVDDAAGDAGQDTAPTSTSTLAETQATSTNSEDLSHAIEEIVQTVASSTSGFVDVFATSSATSSDDTATSTSDALSGAATSTMASTTPVTASSTDSMATTLDGSEGTTATSTDDSAFASSTQTVITGNAVVVANILNMLNASFLNSAGSILFGNFIDEAGTIDLRDGSLFGACGAEGCAGLEGVQLNLLQDAYILNSILMSANSGGNEIGESSTSTAILSGDAFAGLNLVNLANVSFVDSNYLLATLNAFQGVSGDIVFPGLHDFFSALTSAVDPDAIQLDAAADVNNDVSSEALTGDNTIQNVDGPTLIQTGTSEANTNIFNQVNSLLAGEGISILLRITGAFNGEIWGLPDNVTVVQTPMGLYISGNGAGEPDAIDGLGVNATTTAGIDNDVALSARTGENLIENASSTALISTGDAFAGANIINIANQTVIGRNWMLAVFNIFGDLDGNIAFGRPDLWVGARASADGAVEQGTQVEYTITVKNRGDSVANDIVLSEEWDAEHLVIESASTGYESDDGMMRFSLGTLAPGEQTEVTYLASVRDAPQGAEIASRSSAVAHETDNDLIDNTDVTSLRVPSSGGGGTFFPPVAASNLLDSGGSNARTAMSLERISSHMQASAASPRVTQTMVLKNTGNEIAHDVVLRDVLHDPLGEPLHIEEWVIEEIAPNEELLIMYDFEFGGGAPLGRYTIRSEIEGANIDTQSIQNGSIELVAAETPIPVYIPAIPERFEALIAPFVSSERGDADTASISEVTPEDPSTEVPREALVAAAATADENTSALYATLIALLVLFGVIYRVIRNNV